MEWRILQRVRLPDILGSSADNITLEIMSVNGLFLSFILQPMAGSSVSQVSCPAVLIINVDVHRGLYAEAGKGVPILLGTVLTAHSLFFP